MRMRWTCLGAAVILIASLAGAQADSAHLRPHGAMWFNVTDDSATAVPGATVRFPSLGVAFVASDRGKLLVDHVADGAYLVEVRGAGFMPVERVVRVHGDTTTVVIALVPQPPTLDTVHVVEIRLDEFDRRRKNSAGGQFITRADLARTKPVELLYMFRMLHGIQVSSTLNGAASYIHAAKSLGNSCPRGMQIYVDGVLMNPGAPNENILGGSTGPTLPRAQSPGASSGGSTSGGSSTGGGTTRGTRGTPPGITAVNANPNLQPEVEEMNAGAYALFDLNTIPQETVMGIEVYSNGADVPAQFRGRGSECGVILVWTRAPKSMQ